MSLSDLNLLEPDPERLRVDPKAKSLSFFCLKRPARIDARVIADLKAVAAQNGGRNARICLHANPDAPHHDMIVLEHRGKYYRPHKHADKGEAFHVMGGRLGIFAFDDAGRVVDAQALEPGDIYRVEVGMYHAVMPLTDQVLYHENKPGPFLGEGDSIYPDWAPDGSNLEAIRTFVDGLHDILSKG
jgi:glucose-6-phosphate isomerase